MMLILQTPEEEAAIRQKKITANELRDKIKVNGLDPDITIAVNSSLSQN